MGKGSIMSNSLCLTYFSTNSSSGACTPGQAVKLLFLAKLYVAHSWVESGANTGWGQSADLHTQNKLDFIGLGIQIVTTSMLSESIHPTSSTPLLTGIDSPSLVVLVE